MRLGLGLPVSLVHFLIIERTLGFARRAVLESCVSTCVHVDGNRKQESRSSQGTSPTTPSPPSTLPCVSSSSCLGSKNRASPGDQEPALAEVEGGGAKPTTTMDNEKGSCPATPIVVEHDEKDETTRWGCVGKGVPSVTLKLAMDRNGAVDDMSEGPKRFTSQASLDAVHRLRRDCGAVLVGVGTVVRDDPSLTVRRVPLYEGQAQPTRVVLDRTLRMPGAAKCAILGDGIASVIFFSADRADAGARALELKTETTNARAIDSTAGETVPGASPVDFIGLTPRSPGGGVPLVDVLEALYQRGIHHILVEGGPSTARGFLSEGLVDRAVIIRAPVEFSRPVPSDLDDESLRRAGLELVGCTRWEDDNAECWSRPGLSWPKGGIGCWP